MEPVVPGSAWSLHVPAALFPPVLRLRVLVRLTAPSAAPFAAPRPHLGHHSALTAANIADSRSRLAAADRVHSHWLYQSAVVGFDGRSSLELGLLSEHLFSLLGAVGTTVAIGAAGLGSSGNLYGQRVATGKAVAAFQIFSPVSAPTALGLCHHLNMQGSISFADRTLRSEITFCPPAGARGNRLGGGRRDRPLPAGSAATARRDRHAHPRARLRCPAR